MSRIGRKPIEIPSGITVDISGKLVTVKGPKGSLSYTMPAEISVEQVGNKLICKRAKNIRFQCALHGLVRSLINNMITGVNSGFAKQLEIQGVGYRAKTEGKNLVMSLGFSHPVEHPIPSDINISVDKNIIAVTGIDKQRVGQEAANIRGYYPPEPYKGKGIRYVGEQVRRKAGKTVGKK
ncbi:MAG: 50S ribosomal protein L6 [Candidatus Auribacterota bacterium]|jgi:large subunit ribosomal protein L6|nr:50S ribosomal protein L6 [Candidatus Auribacterota bacterium]